MSGAACPYIRIETCQVLCFLYGSIIWPDYGLLLELRTPTQATHSWGCVYTGGLHNCLILLSYHLELYRLLLVTHNIRDTKGRTPQNSTGNYTQLAAMWIQPHEYNYTTFIKPRSFIPKPLLSFPLLSVWLNGCLTVLQVTGSWASTWEWGYKPPAFIVYSNLIPSSLT